MYQYLAILDFEATCANGEVDASWKPELQEIIELPVALVRVDSVEVCGTYGTFVRPTRQPRLTAFCTELTSIRQADLEGQPEIGEAVEGLRVWLRDQGARPDNTLCVTCGDWDLLRMWPRQLRLVEGLSSPWLFRKWCNLKVVYREHTGQKAQGMMGMLHSLGIEHVGRHHRGADDVRNLANIVIHLLHEGVEFHPTSPSR